MSEWKEYTGSDDQKKEIRNADDVLFKMESALFVNEWLNLSITHYLICEPHPLVEMICQQARTGQPVYIKIPTVAKRVDTGATTNIYFRYECTTTPDWNIPGVEYSFENDLASK